MDDIGVDIVNDAGALTVGERGFIERMHKVSMIISRVNTDEDAVREVSKIYNCDQVSATKLVQKAEEFMSTGMVESTDQARDVLMWRLQRIFHVCLDKSVGNETEVTTQPMSLRVEGNKGGETQYEVIQGTKTKIKVAAVNAGLLKLAAEVAVKVARLQGIQIVESNGSGVPNIAIQVNNGPTAQQVDSMDNYDLASSLGATNVKVLPRQAAGKEVSERA